MPLPKRRKSLLHRLSLEHSLSNRSNRSTLSKLTPQPTLKTTPPTTPSIYTQAIRINSAGDILLSKLDPITTHDLTNPTLSTQIFHTLTPSAITVALGIPLLCVQLANASTKWQRKSSQLGINLFANDSAKYLTLIMEPSDPRWGCVNDRVWGKEVGTVVVVRQDGKVITTQQVEGILEFCAGVGGEKMRRVRERFRGGECGECEEGFVRAKEEFMEMDLEVYFRGYFEGMREVRVRNGEEAWVGVVNPLDV